MVLSVSVLWRTGNTQGPSTEYVLLLLLIFFATFAHCNVMISSQATNNHLHISYIPSHSYLSMFTAELHYHICAGTVIEVLCFQRRTADIWTKLWTKSQITCTPQVIWLIIKHKGLCAASKCSVLFLVANLLPSWSTFAFVQFLLALPLMTHCSF